MGSSPSQSISGSDKSLAALSGESDDEVLLVQLLLPSSEFTLRNFLDR
jgi:hypothetical protein